MRFLFYNNGLGFRISRPLPSSTPRTPVRESELRLEAKIEGAKNDLLKTLIGAVAFNSAVVLGAMFGLAKLRVH